MKIISALICSAFFSLICFSVNAQQLQEPVKRNTFFVELLGNSASYYSLNFDRILVSKEKWKLAGRAGASYYYSFDDFNAQSFTIPLEISFLGGKGPNYLELGLGATPFINKSHYKGPMVESDSFRSLNLMFFPRIGYRYQMPKGGTFFKIGFTPFHQVTLKATYQGDVGRSHTWPFWGGIAIGHTFR